MSLVKDPNVQFVRVRQDIFILAILCPIILNSKSHFVQPNVVCPVPVASTFWTPGPDWRQVVVEFSANSWTGVHITYSVIQLGPSPFCQTLRKNKKEKFECWTN
jgi:hypothetical protein